MKRQSVFAVSLVALLFLFSFAQAERTVWYVHPDSSLNSIQAALDSCADNDIVLVAPGTYLENLVWPNTQGIQLLSVLGPELTIIDGDSAGSVVTFDSLTGMDTTSIVRGFTIRNGFADDPWEGGGITVADNSPTICDNIITDNAGGGAIAVMVPGSMPIIIRNTISSNTGSGIMVQGDAIIDTNTIDYNTEFGIWVLFPGNSIRKNTITHNRCGIYGDPVDLLANNIISYNTLDGIWYTEEPSVDNMNRRSWGGNIISFNGRLGINGPGCAHRDIITYNGAGGICPGGHIDSCIIAHNYGPGVIINEFSGHINYCSIFDNVDYGVFNQDSVIRNAEYNWWGDATGPFHPDSNPGGHGDTVSDWVDFIPWLGGPVGFEEQPDQRHETRDIRLSAQPNPFTSSTTIRISCMAHGAERIEIHIYDLAGRLIMDLSRSMPQAPNTMHVSWNGRDHAGKTVAPGVYFIRLNAGDIASTKKVVLIK